MGTRLFVDNLPLTITLAALQEFFSKVPDVTSINIVMDPRTGRAQGHAFVDIASDADATKAIQLLNGTSLEGMRLTVTHSGPAPRQAGFSGNATTEERKNR